MVGAKTTLQDAIQAAHVLGMGVPTNWSTVAGGLAITTSRADGTRIDKEFSGYQSQMVKQADVTLLQYPGCTGCRRPWPRTTSASTSRAPIPAVPR